MSPFYQLGAFGYPVAMALATVLGIGFGFALERAGFGRSSTLVAQFYGDDMRVLKVMFSAIVTTTVGLGIMGGIGFLDLSLIVIPDTWYVPAIVGGGLLGVGFVISGYCPGTALVAVGSGHLDGLVALGGIMLGSLVFGFAYDGLESLYLMTEAGEVTFMGVLGVPWQVLAFGVTLMAIGAFFAGEKAERYFAPRHEREAPTEHDDPGVRNAVLGTLAALSVVGLATLAISPAEAEEAHVDVAALESITPVELADRLTTGFEDLYIVDLRAEADCQEANVRGAMCVGEDGPAFIATLPATRTLVLYGADELQEVPDEVARFGGSVRVLAGGWEAFQEEILEAPAVPENPTPTAVTEYRHRAALNAYFTGNEAPAAPVVARLVAVQRADGPRGGGC